MVDFMLQRQSWVAATETKRHKKPEIFTIWPFIRKNMPISGLDKLYRRFEGWVVGSMGFPGSSAGKESACNVGDPGSIPGSGKSPGEGIGYPLQYSWASLVALMAMQETQVQSLGWDDPLEKEMANHLSILAWRIPMDRGAWRTTIHRVAKSQTQLKWLSMHGRTYTHTHENKHS